jgi:hypothetical protein
VSAVATIAAATWTSLGGPATASQPEAITA